MAETRENREPDSPTRYQSSPESIELAHERMRDIKAALTRGTDGKVTASYAEMDWHGMNMQPPRTSWQEMEIEERYDLLLHALDESIWSLEPSAKWDEPRDSQKLALEFVKDDQRPPWPSEIAEANRQKQPKDQDTSTGNEKAKAKDADCSM